MSKAFTKDEGDPGPGAPLRLPSPLPPGAKNYVTPGGLKRLRDELDRLVEEERPRAAMEAGAGSGGAGSAGTRSSERLTALDARIGHLRESLETAVVVPPPGAGSEDRVRFGAAVNVRDEQDGRAMRYRIVGVDEADPERGSISWVSPIAKALIGAEPGDVIEVDLPSGRKSLEILDVSYE